MNAISSVIVAAVILFQASIALAACGTPQTGIDYYGNDILSRKISTNNPQEAFKICCEACQNHSIAIPQPKCKGFTIANGVCYLKHSMHTSSQKEGAVSGITQEPTSACANLIDNVDYYGNDIRHFHVGHNADKAKNLCCAGCKNEGNCHAFTLFGGICYLKHSVGQPIPKPGAFSGQYKRPPQVSKMCSVPKSNIDFYGNDIRHFHVGSGNNAYGMCCDACAATEGHKCRGFTISDGFCYLKHAVHSARPTFPKHVVSGTYPAADNCPRLLVDIDWYGNDLWNFKTSSTDPVKAVNECCDKCHATRGCKGWTHYQNYCYLKSKATQGSVKVGATSSGRTGIHH